MGRTNVEIDDGLIHAVMARHRLRTKREAVDWAPRRTSRRALRRTVARDELTSLEGVGIGATLAEIRPDDAHRRSGIHHVDTSVRIAPVLPTLDSSDVR